nr:hypothetical protein BaRGS_006159 [Batillaria attramentaria]
MASGESLPPKEKKKKYANRWKKCTEDEAEETDSFVIDMHETPAEFPQFTQGIPALHKGINYLTEDERKKRERNIDAEVDGISGKDSV